MQESNLRLSAYKTEVLPLKLMTIQVEITLPRFAQNLCPVKESNPRMLCVKEPFCRYTNRAIACLIKWQFAHLISHFAISSFIF
jgi:hypothetical protein